MTVAGMKVIPTFGPVVMGSSTLRAGTATARVSTGGAVSRLGGLDLPDSSDLPDAPRPPWEPIPIPIGPWWARQQWHATPAPSSVVKCLGVRGGAVGGGYGSTGTFIDLIPMPPGPNERGFHELLRVIKNGDEASPLKFWRFFMTASRVDGKKKLGNPDLGNANCVPLILDGKKCPFGSELARSFGRHMMVMSKRSIRLLAGSESCGISCVSAIRQLFAIQMPSFFSRRTPQFSTIRSTSFRQDIAVRSGVWKKRLHEQWQPFAPILIW